MVWSRWEAGLLQLERYWTSAHGLVTVDVGHSVGVSIAMDDKLSPHIAYYDWDNGLLKHAWLDVSSWHVETVAPAGALNRMGIYPGTSIVLDGNRAPWISYYDATEKHLKVAHK